MDLSPYIDELRHQLGVAAQAAGDDARGVADRLTAVLEPATRLVLLDALAAAADEITAELAPGSVELRLRGREPELVVTPPPIDEPRSDDGPGVAPPGATLPSVDDGGAGGTARLNLRLPESLKSRIEEAAHQEGLSLNAWLVRAAAAAADPPHRPATPSPGSTRGGQRFTGWVR